MTHLDARYVSRLSPPLSLPGQRDDVGNATAIVLRTISLFAVVTQLDVRASGPTDAVFRSSSPWAGPRSDAFRSAAGYFRRRLASL